MNIYCLLVHKKEMNNGSIYTLYHLILITPPPIFQMKKLRFLERLNSLLQVTLLVTEGPEPEIQKALLLSTQTTHHPPLSMMCRKSKHFEHLYS